MKITVEFDYDDNLAKAIALRNGGRGLAGSYEIAQWAKEELAVQAEGLVEQTRIQMEANEPS